MPAAPARKITLSVTAFNIGKNFQLNIYQKLNIEKLYLKQISSLTGI